MRSAALCQSPFISCVPSQEIRRALHAPEAEPWHLRPGELRTVLSTLVDNQSFPRYSRQFDATTSRAINFVGLRSVWLCRICGGKKSSMHAHPSHSERAKVEPFRRGTVPVRSNLC